MKCKVCGTFIEDYDARFCPTCGAYIEPDDKTIVVPGAYAETSSAGKPTIIMQGHYDHPLPTHRLPNVPQPYIPPYKPESTYHPVAPPTSGAATLSLILGIIAWTVLPIVGALGAVIAGHIARREIRTAGGQLGGNGLAMAGLILGYLQLVPLVIGVCLFILFMMAVIFTV